MTDLEHLHLVHETLAAGYKLPRRGGYTYYVCHELCGHLEVCEHETIPVYVQNRQRVNNFVDTLMPILKEHDLEVGIWDRPFLRIAFKNNTNMVKFITNDNLKHYGDSYPYIIPDIAWNGFGVEDLD